MEIIVASDIHYAKVWDEIDRTLPSHLSYHNPNTALRLMLKGLNKSQKLFFNGDLIDYYYADYLGGNKTNLDLFIAELDECQAEYFFNLGNHEYRRYAYNFRVRGLRHVLISNKDRQQYLSKIHSKFRGWKEISSMTVRMSKHNPVKLPMFSNYYHRDFDWATCLVLNTGPELVFSPRYTYRPKYWRWIFSTHPAVRGLSESQLKYTANLLNSVDDREIIIMLHCPPFFNPGHFKPFKLEKRTHLFDLIMHGLTYGYFIKNNWEFMELIMQSNKNITVVTSHTHIPKQYLIHKDSRQVSETSLTELNRLRQDASVIKFISTPALGAAHSKSEGGYVKINQNEIVYQYIKTMDRGIDQVSRD